MRADLVRVGISSTLTYFQSFLKGSEGTVLVTILGL